MARTSHFGFAFTVLCPHYERVATFALWWQIKSKDRTHTPQYVQAQDFYVRFFFGPKLIHRRRCLFNEKPAAKWKLVRDVQLIRGHQNGFNSIARRVFPEILELIKYRDGPSVTPEARIGHIYPLTPCEARNGIWTLAGVTIVPYMCIMRLMLIDDDKWLMTTDMLPSLLSHFVGKK